MKKLFAILSVLYFAGCTPKAANPTIISLLDGAVMFEKLNNDMVIYAPILLERKADKVYISTYFTYEEVLRDNAPYFPSSAIKDLFERTDGLRNADLLSLFESGEPFVLNNYEPFNLKESYALIIQEGKTIGETFFNSHRRLDRLPPPNSYYYMISIIAGDTIAYIMVGTWDWEYGIPPQMPEYFVERDGKYYWRSPETAKAFFHQLSTDATGMPERLQMVQQAYNLILDTLQVKQ